MRNLRQKLSIARGERHAELLFTNANLVNVLNPRCPQLKLANWKRTVKLGQ